MANDKERALALIEDYIWRMTKMLPKKKNKKPYDFAATSYISWAAEEVYDWVRTSNDTPINAVESFVRKMDTYACRNKASSYIFSTAKDTAEDILDVLIIDLMSGGREK